MQFHREIGDRESQGQLALSIDLERCLGCRSCEAACKLEHQLGSDVARNRVLWMQFEGIARLDFVYAVCQQCERPACVRACAHNPKALTKDPKDGIVKVKLDLCTGCQECVKACPYNAISFDFRYQKAQKCDLCSDRREHGFQPACVSVCPGRALDYGPVDELLAKAAAEGRE
ncbi:MAG: 4Fe-4S dicluster domain-containing protein, partial [Chloroflexota bacterium]